MEKSSIYFERGRVTLVFTILLFRLSLDFLYINFVIPFYGSNYMGFNYEFDAYRYSASIFIMLIPTILCRNKLKSYSDFIYLTSLTSVIVPMSSLWGLDPEKNIEALLTVVVSVIISIYITRTASIKSVRFPFFKNGLKVVEYICICAVLYLLALYVLTGAISNLNFNMAKVYQFRQENSALTDIGLLSYLNIWVYKVFNVFLISYCIWKKKFALLAFSLISQLVFFGVSAHKSVFFFPFIVFFCFWYFRKYNSLYFIPIIFIVICVGAYATSLMLDNHFIASVLVRRLFFVPASTTFTYFEFAEKFGHIYWSNSILSFSDAYPYQKSLSLVIGDYILGSAASYKYLGANNGYISTGFIHGGYVGVLFYSLLFGYLLKMFDSLVKFGIPLWLSISLTIIPMRDVIISSDLMTSLLTHGLLLSLLILILCRRRESATLLDK